MAGNKNDAGATPGDAKDSQADQNTRLETFDLAGMGADMADDKSAETFEVINEETPVFFDQETGEPVEDGDEGDEGADGDGDAEGDDKPAAADGDGDEDDDARTDRKLEPWMERRLRRERRKAEREIAAKDAEIERLKADKKSDAPDIGERPKSEDFDDYEDYLTAKDEWEIKKAETTAKPKKDEKPAPQADAEVINAIEDIRDEIADTHPDLWKTVTSSETKIDISRDMVIAIAEADHPASVLEQLLANPGMATEICGLSPRRAAMKIAKMDVPAKAKAKAKEADADADVDKDDPPPRRRSEAPEPIKPVAGRNAPDKTYQDMDFNEFERKRRHEESTATDWW